MESIELTEFKDILSGRYRKNNKEYPLLFGIRENQNGNRFITALYIDNENNKINILLNWEIDELKDKITYKIIENKKLSKKIEEYETLMKNFKEFFKIIKSLSLFSIIKSTFRFDINLYINDSDLAYWVYSKIYYGNLDKDTYLELIKIGEKDILNLGEGTIDIIARKFIEKGLSNSQKNVTIET